MNFFDVNTVALEVWGYKLSWLEFIGTIFNLASVWLMTRNRLITWPIGIIGSILFLVLFWQIRLYADFFEQIYYIVTGFWGWWLWQKSGAPDEGPVHRNTRRQNLIAITATVIFSVLAGWANSNLNVWLPRWFPETASFAYLDATTTIASFTAQILMAYRRLECWFIWIAVDAIGIWLYYEKGVVFIAALYAIFLVLAIKGLLAWRQNLVEQVAAA